MRAFTPKVVHHLWDRMRELIPKPDDRHPLGCHRPRASDELCLWGMLIRLVTGCSWEDAEAMLQGQVSDTTLRARRNEWVNAGVFDSLFRGALADYDRAGLLHLTHAAADGSLHKAPCGGPGSGPNPCDRAKLGWKWLIVVDSTGIPVGWVIAGANRQDSVLLSTSLDAVPAKLRRRIRWLHLDRGFDNNNVRKDLRRRRMSTAGIARKKPRGSVDWVPPAPKFPGRRWQVERTNSWISNYGQMRRNTDRREDHRHAQLALVATILIIGKLIDHADNTPIR